MKVFQRNTILYLLIIHLCLFIIENGNTLCSQLLLHPPFKPKRLIHLCPDGSIQVLSAVDDSSNVNNQQQYRLNYSNSAVIPSIQHNHLPTSKSLGLFKQYSFDFR